MNRISELNNPGVWWRLVHLWRWVGVFDLILQYSIKVSTRTQLPDLLPLNTYNTCTNTCIHKYTHVHVYNPTECDPKCWRSHRRKLFVPKWYICWKICFRDIEHKTHVIMIGFVLYHDLLSVLAEYFRQIFVSTHAQIIRIYCLKRMIYVAYTFILIWRNMLTHFSYI